MSNNVLVFSHEQDVDGVLSAAILKLAFGTPEIVLTNYGLENMIWMGRKIEVFAQSMPTGTIVIADMGPNLESYLPVASALEAAKKSGWNTIWIDHHVWPAGLVSEIGQVCQVMLYDGSNGNKKCTAEICAEKFAPNNATALHLARIARRTDFPDGERFPIPPLTALISYYVGFPHLRHKLETVIMENVIKGVLWDTTMQEDVIEASRLIDSSIEQSVENMLLKQVAGTGVTLSIAIARADSFVSRSILLGRIMDENNIDLAFAYTLDGKVSIRRKEPSACGKVLDCSIVAREFREGGGHAGAAGGFLRNAPIKAGEQETQAVNEIAQAVTAYIAQIT